MRRREFLATASIGATAALLGEKLSVAEGSTPTQPAQPNGDMSLKIGLLQMTSSIVDTKAAMDPDDVRRRQEHSVQHAEEFCRKAAAQGADIAVFPEMWNIGYTGFDSTQQKAKEHWLNLAIDGESSYIRHFAALAAELEMAIAVTYLQKWNPAPRNSVSLISRKGEIVLTYSKVHTCDFTATEALLTPGEDFPVCTLDTRLGPVRIGCMICYDREFPESARILMLNGAEVVLVPNACQFHQVQMDQLKTRAYENALAVAMTNYAGLPFDGNSAAFDATGRSLVDPVSFGIELVQIARVDLQELRKYRTETIWGNAFRRPRKYKALIAESTETAFKRENFYGQHFDPLTR